MATQTTLLENGIHKHTTGRSGRSETFYTFQFCGHTGYIKQAVQNTPGTSVVSNSWMNSKAGGSNSVLVLLHTPELLEQLQANYKSICSEKGKKA